MKPPKVQKNYTVCGVCRNILLLSWNRTGRLPSIFLNFFKFTLHQEILLLLIEHKSQHSWGDRSFSSFAPCIWNSLHLIFVPQHSNLFSKLVVYVKVFKD